jgi:hypothetical protein
MKIIKSLSPFILLLIIGAISFRFLFFISYIKGQKNDLRQQLLSENNTALVEVEFLNSDVFENKNGFEWKEHNKELVINGIYHEIISIKKYKDHTIVSIIEDKAENTLFKKFFCMNKGIHKDFSDLIKLLLNFTCIQNVPQINFVQKQEIVQFNSGVFQFTDSQFYLKKIKPPQA